VSGEFNFQLEAFVDTRNIGPPIFVDTSAPNEFQPGTVYVYADVPIQGILFIDTSAMIGIVQGTCTRTDPDFLDPDVFQGKGICQFTYEIFDGNVVIASFQGEGAVQNGFSSALTVTGGLGLFQGATGQVTLIPATLNSTSTEDDFLSVLGVVPELDESIDFLSSEDGYYMFADVFINLLDLITDDFLIDDNFIDDNFIDDNFVDDNFIPFDDAFFPTDDFPFPTASPFPSPAINPSLIPEGAVLCEGLEPVDYCDCEEDSDCTFNPEERCGCDEAKLCCGIPL
jgi:hypothetical protein